MKLTEEAYNSLCVTVGSLFASAIVGAFLMMVGMATCSAYRIVQHAYPKACCEGPSAFDEK